MNKQWIVTKKNSSIFLIMHDYFIAGGGLAKW